MTEARSSRGSAVRSRRWRCPLATRSSGSSARPGNSCSPI
jgi:hypothetical protein